MSDATPADPTPTPVVPTIDPPPPPAPVALSPVELSAMTDDELAAHLADVTAEYKAREKALRDQAAAVAARTAALRKAEGQGSATLTAEAPTE